jgi:hypothetical protein
VQGKINPNIYNKSKPIKEFRPDIYIGMPKNSKRRKDNNSTKVVNQIWTTVYKVVLNG